MPNQMRRGMNGTPRAGKAGTEIRKWKPVGIFGPRGRGILARGVLGRMESPAEAKDRRLG